MFECNALIHWNVVFDCSTKSGTVTRLFLLGLLSSLDFLGRDLVDGSFSEGRGIMDITKVFALMVIAAWKADNSTFYTTFMY